MPIHSIPEIVPSWNSGECAHRYVQADLRQMKVICADCKEVQPDILVKISQREQHNAHE